MGQADSKRRSPLSTDRKNGKNWKRERTDEYLDSIGDSALHVQLVLIGTTRGGKSATGNTILDREVFQIEANKTNVTKTCQVHSSKFGRRVITVVDTPGLCDEAVPDDTVMMEIKRCFHEDIAPGPQAILLVVPLGRHSEKDQEALRVSQEIFGENSLKHTLVVFTHWDSGSQKTFEHSSQCEGGLLQKLVEQCEGRYHLFNNTETEDRTQVSELLKKVNKMMLEKPSTDLNTATSGLESEYVWVENLNAGVQRRRDAMKQCEEIVAKDEEDLNKLQDEIEAIKHQMENTTEDQRQGQLNELKEKQKEAQDKEQKISSAMKIRETLQEQVDKKKMEIEILEDLLRHRERLEEDTRREDTENRGEQLDTQQQDTAGIENGTGSRQVNDNPEKEGKLEKETIQREDKNTPAPEQSNVSSREYLQKQEGMRKEYAENTGKPVDTAETENTSLLSKINDNLEKEGKLEKETVQREDRNTPAPVQSIFSMRENLLRQDDLIKSKREEEEQAATERQLKYKADLERLRNAILD